MRIQLWLVGKMHFQAVHFAASQCILPTRHLQLNAHERLLETKMAVGRENDELARLNEYTHNDQ
jgi:hypothetical protein